jgi:hypothetical protein
MALYKKKYAGKSVQQNSGKPQQGKSPFQQKEHKQKQNRNKDQQTENKQKQNIVQQTEQESQQQIIPVKKGIVSKLTGLFKKK